MQRKTGHLLWVVIAAAVGTLLLAWQYWDYRLIADRLPPDVRMAGLQVGGMTQAQALNALEVAFATPLTATYRHHALSLCPSAVDLRYDAVQTSANLDLALTEWRGTEGFISHVLRRHPGSITVPVAVTFSDEQLSRFLDRIVDQYDGPPQEPVALPAALDFRPSRPGSSLDAEASRARLAAALVSAAKGEVALVVEVAEAPPKDIGLLEGLIHGLLDDHPGLIPGVFVKDLQTGEELEINGDVAFAGLSVLKIAVLEEVYRVLDQSPDVETTRLISETMTESGNSTANALLRDVVDGGDGYRAVKKLTASMHRLGLTNTYMGAPYDEKDVGSEMVTPANSRTDISTEPDPFIQTTPLDVGLLLEMIYHCSQGGGTLIMTYPDDLTTKECRDMIDWMSGNRVDTLLEAGVPDGTDVAHKHGWTSDTHADAGILFTPGGDLVLVIFLHRAQWLEWDESAPLIADISTAAYNYFNPPR